MLPSGKKTAIHINEIQKIEYKATNKKAKITNGILHLQVVIGKMFIHKDNI